MREDDRLAPVGEEVGEDVHAVVGGELLREINAVRRQPVEQKHEIHIQSLSSDHFRMLQGLETSKGPLSLL